MDGQPEREPDPEPAAEPPPDSPPAQVPPEPAPEPPPEPPPEQPTQPPEPVQSPQRSLSSPPRRPSATAPISPAAPASPAPAPPGVTSSDSRQSFLNALDTEFIYYASALRELSPHLAHPEQRASLEQWVRRLFSPEYCSEALKEKRNRLVCYITLWLCGALGDDGVLPECPARGPPPMPQDLGAAPYTTASWEVDNQWLHFLKSVSAQEKAKCGQHQDGCPAAEASQGWELDQELKLLLHLAAPLRPQLESSGERRLCSLWLRFLCSATPQDCPALRGLRNQYARVLLGYLHGGELQGPFCAEPPWGQALPALEVTGAAEASDGGGADEAGSVGGDFLSMQPVPEEGAFCYVVVDGVVPVDFKC